MSQIFFEHDIHWKTQIVAQLLLEGDETDKIETIRSRGGDNKVKIALRVPIAASATPEYTNRLDAIPTTKLIAPGT